MAEGRGGRERKKTIDWQRVAGALGANDETDLIRCRQCRANGVVPYIAEHILTAHPASPEARKVRQIVSGEERPAGARPKDGVRKSGQPPGSRRPPTRRRV